MTWRESMLRSDAEPRWTIDGHTMRANGPWLKNAGRIEVVPVECFRAAVDTLRWIAHIEPDPDEGVRPLDDLLDQVQGEALEVLNRLGEQS